MARKAGVVKDEIQQQYDYVYEIPFDSAYQYHAVFYNHQGAGVIFIAGSPEVLTARGMQLTSEQQAQLDAIQ